MGRRCVGSVAPIVCGGTWVTTMMSALRGRRLRGGTRSQYAMRKEHSLCHFGLVVGGSSLRLRNQRQT